MFSSIRRGTWFDPKLADVIIRLEHDRTWCASLQTSVVDDLVIESEPGRERQLVDANGLDRIARAFAEIIDAKSPFTFHHSTNVAEYARAVANVMGLDAVTQRRIYRAGLLHDIGKLGARPESGAQS